MQRGMTYEFKRLVFTWEGRCDICDAWTRHGTRTVGKMRYRRMCEDCARNRFAGDITSGLESGVEVKSQ